MEDDYADAEHGGGRMERVVAVGASAGGVEALQGLVAALPPVLPAAILVVLHMPSGATSALAPILDRAGPLPVSTVRTGQLMSPGHIYVASPNYHLLLDDAHAMLSTGPTENRHRPSIDALFRSVAINAGPRGVGVLLSGVLDDGVAGLWAINRRAGVTVVQSPEEALYPNLPRNALRELDVDHVLPVAGIAGLIAELAEKPVDQLKRPLDDAENVNGTDASALVTEDRIARGEVVFGPGDSVELGPMAGYMCPDCNGSLMRVARHRYRCRVGHGWTGDALLEAQDNNFENALWAALRSLDEKVNLARRMSEQYRGGGPFTERYARMAKEAADAAETLRSHLREAGIRRAPFAVEE
jgi:two-component system chemotaxis response regulator CheB